jgi:hypothetical protein
VFYRLSATKSELCCQFSPLQQLLLLQQNPNFGFAYPPGTYLGDLAPATRPDLFLWQQNPNFQVALFLLFAYSQAAIATKTELSALSVIWGSRTRIALRGS